MIPAGMSEVNFVYKPIPLIIGIILTYLTLGGVVLFYLLVGLKFVLQFIVGLRQLSSMIFNTYII
jgi:uncharacterized membrane protein